MTAVYHGVMTTNERLTDFLLARIAEDEAAVEMPTGARRNGKATARRRLAECQAKRAIVKASQEFVQPGGRGTPFVWDGASEMAMAALLALAPVYADHPDYREEWKP